MNKIAANSGKISRNARGGAMCSVCGAESIVYENICKRSKLFGEILLILCFFFSVANIFEKHNFAVFKLCSHFLCIFAYNGFILCKLNILTEIFGEPFSYGSKAEFGLIFALRSAEMRAKDNLCALCDKIFNCRKSGNNSFIVCDFAVLKRNIEIAANKNLFACHIDIFDCFFVQSIHYDYLSFNIIRKVFLFSTNLL